VETDALVNAIIGEVAPNWQLRLLSMGLTLNRQVDAEKLASTGMPVDDRTVRYIVDKINKQLCDDTSAHRLRIGDLALAHWTMRDSRGVEAFERRFHSTISKIVNRFRNQQADELRQKLRIKLFVAQADAKPRIADYAGFGFLENWLKVTALRAFVDVERSEKMARQSIELDDVFADGGTSPTGDIIRRELRALVKVAFAQAVAGLSSRERNFLRHALIDHHTLEQIAAAYTVHRATVARVLAAAKDNIMFAIKSTLSASNETDMTHVLSLVSGSIDLSLSRVLRAA
jgi:RNA polymerase sigma-70 factor, ECF subfamily